MYLGYQNGQIKFYTEQPLDLAFYNIDRVEETELEYVLDGDCYVLKDEAWEEEQAKKEAERVSKLTCTKRVFALMLQELGITYTMLKQLIATNEQAQLEWDLSVQLERGNPLLDIMAYPLGITSEQLDGLFKYANGEITIEEFKGIGKEPEEEPPVEPDEPVVDPVEGEDPEVNND